MWFNIIGFYTILRREVVRFLRIWTQTLLPSPITAFLYLLIFGQCMGTRLGLVHGYPYAYYIVPGLILMSVITNAYSNVVFAFFGAKFQRFIEEMYIAPMGPLEILLGYVSAGVLRGALTGMIVAAMAQFFGFFTLANPGAAFTVLVLTALVFSLAGLINGIYARKFDDVGFVPTFILTPLTYLGGVFYPIEMLPAAWQPLASLNPIFYMVDGFRFGLLGISEIPLHTSISLLVGINLILFSISYRLLATGKGVRT